MTGALFAKGLVFGFLLAATVGPMWVLCFRRTVAAGALTGLASGMGVAAGDAFYGAVAAFGLTAVSGVLLVYKFWIGLAGAIFLTWLGVKSLVSVPKVEEGKSAETRGLAGAFFSTFGLTLANPPTILAFAAIFAGLGLVSSEDYGAAGAIVAGVFAGSALWWAILACAAGRLRTRLGPRVLRGINVLSGVTILGFAGWQAVALFR